MSSAGSVSGKKYASDYHAFIDYKTHTVTAEARYSLPPEALLRAIHDPDKYINFSPYLQTYEITLRTSTLVQATLTECYPVVLGFSGTAHGTMEIEIRENGVFVSSEFNKGQRAEVASTMEVIVEEVEGGSAVRRIVVMKKNPRLLDSYVVKKAEEPLAGMFEELGRVAASMAKK